MIIIAFDENKNKCFANIQGLEIAYYLRHGEEEGIEGFRRTISGRMYWLTKLFNKEYRNNAQDDDGIFFKITFIGYSKLDDFVSECRKYKKEEV